MPEPPVIPFVSLVAAKWIVVGVLYSFLPLTILTYLLSRRFQRQAEVRRILSVLSIDEGIASSFGVDKLHYYVAAFLYISIVTGVGLVLLFFPQEIGLRNGEFPTVSMSAGPSPATIEAPPGDRDESRGEAAASPGAAAQAAASVRFPHPGSRLVFAMAFFGAYLWGLQYLFRRYSLNDLLPSVYYSMSVRMMVAGIVALVIFNAGKALGGDGGSSGGITDNIWPTLAFVLGMFPQRGVRWLTERLPFFAAAPDSSVRAMPLEMIEGMEPHDVLRLEEHGIDSCYDLAEADFVPLILRTPYSARQLIDWILQAKLIMYVGDAIKDLRKNGIRTILDLQNMGDEHREGHDQGADEKLNELVMGTAVTEAAIRQAQASLNKQAEEISRLQEAGKRIGTFWHDSPLKAVSDAPVKAPSTSL